MSERTIAFVALFSGIFFSRYLPAERGLWLRMALGAAISLALWLVLSRIARQRRQTKHRPAPEKGE